MIRFLFFFIVVFIYLASCDKSTRDSAKINFISIQTGDKFDINDTIEYIIKEYKDNCISKHKYIGIFGRSFPSRNDILVLMGLSGFHFKNNDKSPIAFSVLDSIPVVMYITDINLLQKKNTETYNTYKKILNNFIDQDTLVGLYSPPIWIVELNKDSTRLYKSWEEYDMKVGFYHPSD